MTRLAIILVLYRSRAELPALWDCLAAQSLTGWRVIALDNSPEDGGGDFLAGLGDARVEVVRNPANLGFARAVNQGLTRALNDGAERCLLLNPDTEFAPDFLAGLMAAWDATGAQVIAPRVMYHDDPERAWYAGGHFEDGWVFTNRHDPHIPGGPGSRIVEFASGCCLGLSAAVLRRVGLLDESFFVYWEDADYCLRLKQAGVPIQYVEEPVLLHHSGASTGGGERSAVGEVLYFGNYAVLLRKHFPLRRALQVLLRTFLKERSRPGLRPGSAGRIGRALLQGFLRRRRPLPRI
jgi:GT2 family glycosyltransferase